jgi:PAS domain S-box-containing protein
MDMAPAGSVFSEENFRRIVENAPIGILIIDRNMNWRFLNQRFCEITGYTREELLNKTFLDITYKGDIENNLNLYNKMLAGEVNEYFYEKRYVRKNGNIIWVRLAVAGVRIDGEYSHMVVSVEDINESKNYQKALEEKNEELDTLFYKASHDLKAPVTTLSGLCHLLRIENIGLQTNESFLHLENTVARLQSQNESLLQLTRIHDWKPSMHPTGLGSLVEDAIKGLVTNGEEIRLTDLEVSINTDPKLLSMAVRNIVENGIKYSKAGDHARILIDYVQMPGRNKITVSDNGVGISRVELGRIFDMFYKASENSHGSGMGLYIARKAIEKLNGEIIASSAEGEGSVFSILLPTN